MPSYYCRVKETDGLIEYYREYFILNSGSKGNVAPIRLLILNMGAYFDVPHFMQMEETNNSVWFFKIVDGELVGFRTWWVVLFGIIGSLSLFIWLVRRRSKQ